MQKLQQIIKEAFEPRTNIPPANADKTVKDAVFAVLAELDTGRLRVASRKGDSQEWETHQWIKKAVLLSFRLEDNHMSGAGFTHFFDKVPSKFAHYSEENFRNGGFRVV